MKPKLYNNGAAESWKMDINDGEYMWDNEPYRSPTRPQVFVYWMNSRAPTPF